MANCAVSHLVILSTLIIGALIIADDSKAWCNIQRDYLYKVDASASSLLQSTSPHFTKDFATSGISSAIAAFEHASSPRPNRITVICDSRCSGIGDRIRGLPFATSLALLLDRQLVIDQSLLSYVPRDATPFYFRHDCSEAAPIGMIHDLSKVDDPNIFITSSCSSLPNWSAVQIGADEQVLSLLEGIRNECGSQNGEHSLYLCGAAFIHRIEFLQAPIKEAYNVVKALEPLLPNAAYTAIHIRAGGSNVSVGGATDAQFRAVPWNDGYVSDIATKWVQAFQTISYTGCTRNIAVISDSIRTISEIRFAARDRILVTHCCDQPLHRAKTKRLEFFRQEVIDLFLLARAGKIYAGNGHFVTLGAYWLGANGPLITRVASAEDIKQVLIQILSESGCEDIKA
jgi:hypothetical protein